MLKKFDFIYKFIIALLVFTLFLTVINLIVPLNSLVNSLLSLIGILFICLISGFKCGLNSEEKAYLKGLKRGLIYVAILLLLNLLTLSFSFSLKNFLYYLLIIMTSILGSIIGINRKHTK